MDTKTRPLPICRRCGSVLDAPRVNPASGHHERKCCDCERWHPLPRREKVKA